MFDDKKNSTLSDRQDRSAHARRRPSVDKEMTSRRRISRSSRRRCRRRSRTRARGCIGVHELRTRADGARVGLIKVLHRNRSDNPRVPSRRSAREAAAHVPGRRRDRIVHGLVPDGASRALGAAVRGDDRKGPGRDGTPSPAAWTTRLAAAGAILGGSRPALVFRKSSAPDEQPITAAGGDAEEELPDQEDSVSAGATGASRRRQGLHSGAPARFASPRGGRCAFAWETSTPASTSSSRRRGALDLPATRDGRLRVGTVEHLFVALGASSTREGLVIEIEGPEIPLVDGGWRGFVDALAHSAPRHRSRRWGRARRPDRRGASCYELRPSAASEVHVASPVDSVTIGSPRCGWDGDLVDFATAAHGPDVRLRARGRRPARARPREAVSPSSVVVISRTRSTARGRRSARMSPRAQLPRPHR